MTVAMSVYLQVDDGDENDDIVGTRATARNIKVKRLHRIRDKCHENNRKVRVGEGEAVELRNKRVRVLVKKIKCQIATNLLRKLTAKTTFGDF